MLHQFAVKRMFCGLLFIFFVFSTQAVDNKDTWVTFEWALLVREVNQKTGLFDDDFAVSIEEDIVKIKPGSIYKFYFRESSPLYYYLFVYSEEAAFTLLYPGKGKGYDTPLPAKGELFVPAHIWQETQEAGTEQEFFLVVCRESLEKIAGFKANFSRFFKLVHNEQKTAKEQEIRETVYSELVHLSKTYLMPETQIKQGVLVSTTFKAEKDRVQQVSFAAPYFIKRFSLEWGE